MPCTNIGGAIVCTRGQRPIRCRDCGVASNLLCDFPVNGKTCDRPMCAAHAKEVGPNRHYCRIHVAQSEGT